MARITGTYAAPKQTWYINSINLFEGVPDADVQAWIARCGPRTFAAGERIVDAVTTPPEQVFVVHEGAVRLVLSHPRPETIDLLGRGQLFGVSAAFGGGRLGLHADALTRVQVCAAEGKGFLSALGSCPDIVLNLVRQAGIHIMQFGGGYLQPEQRSAQIRLAEVLQRLALTAADRVPGRLRIPACVSRGTLAYQVGCTRETVARMLSNLEATGAVERQGRTILIDPTQLEEIITSGGSVPVIQQAVNERA